MYGNFGGFGGYIPEEYAAPAPLTSGLDALAAQPVAAPMATPTTGYSEATQAKLDAQNAYLADYIARTGFDTAIAKPYQTTFRRGYGDKDIATVSTGEPLAEKYKQLEQISEEDAAAMLSEAPPLEQRLVSSFAPETNQGQSGGRLAAKYNTPFRLYDGKKLVYEGVGPEAAAEAARLAEQISQEKGAKADWKVEQQFGDKWVTASKDQPDVQGGLLGAVLKYGLPLAASFIPGLNVLATMAVAGAASTGGNLLAGESLKNSLISGGLSAATAGLMGGTAVGQSIQKGIGNAVGSVVPGLAPGATGALAQAAPSLADEIVVTGTRNALSPLLTGAASTALAGGLSSVGNSLLTPKLEPLNPQAQAPDTSLAAQAPPSSLAVLPDELPGITVTGSTLPSNVLTDVGSALTTLPSLAVQPSTPNELPELVAEASKLPAEQAKVVLPVPLAVNPTPNELPELVAEASKLPAEQAKVVPPVPLAVNPPTPNELPEVVAEASKLPKEPTKVVPPVPLAVNPPTPNELPEVVAEASKLPKDTTLTDKGSIFPVPPPSILGPALSGADTTPPADKKLTLSDKLELAGLAVSGVGALIGGGGKGTAAGVIPGGLGGLNPIFTSKLPTGADVIIPGGVGTASNFASRPMTEEDWLTYGQRPEKSFFNYVPQPPTGMAHGGSLAAKRGGRPSRSSFAVNGPGTGRSDDIPAVLSDGEYVIDAETVALLGDGSSKAGAQKLDDLRVKIRKHKGRRLSQGRFSSDAKKPEAYLTGGRI
jgi:hypothetical protein